MTRVYDEIVDFIAAGPNPDAVAHFEASELAKSYVADLLHKEKTASLTAEERSELDHFLKLEHVMRLAKARARSRKSQ